MVKGVFAKKETLYWLNPNKIRIWSLQNLLLSIVSVLRFPIGIPLRGIVRNSSSIARNIEELRRIARNCENYRVCNCAQAKSTCVRKPSLYKEEIIENA